MQKYQAPAITELGPIQHLTKGGPVPIATDTLELLGSL